MIDVPGELSGGGALGAWLNRLRKAVIARTPRPCVGVNLDQSTSGFIYRPTIGGGGGGGASRAFEISRTGTYSFAIRQGYIEVPAIWPTDTTTRVEILNHSTERLRSHDYPASSIGDWPGGITSSTPATFTITEDSEDDWDVWYEVAQSAASPDVIVLVLRCEVAGERLYHSSGIFNSHLYHRTIVPIGTVSAESIVQMADGNQGNQANNGGVRYCGVWSATRRYFPGDLVKHEVSPGVYALRCFPGILESTIYGFRQQSIIGYEPNDSSYPWVIFNV